MSHARLRFPRIHGSGSRRKVSWTIGPEGQLAVITGSSVSIFPIGSQTVADDLTVVRTRGQLVLQLLTAAAGLDGFQWAFGMAVVTENAFGIGVTAVPDPLVDIAWDGWFVHETGWMVSEDSGPDPASPAVTLRLVLDSKAMRKTHQTDVVIAVLGVTEVGTSTMQASLATRLLFKLP